MYRGSAAYRWALVVLGWLPAALVAGYMLYQGWNGLAHGIGSRRPWTLGQRLLTEPRVLMDYLDLLWLPRPFTPGLFNDQIQASTSLFSPATTLPALLAVLGLIAGACLLRRKLPAVALVILFYFVVQSLESSTIALELYYEHRNYLPAMLMFWPLALWLCGVLQMSPASTNARGIDAGDAPDVRGKAKGVLAVVLVLGLALMTHARADLWGNSHDQALLWAKLNPASPRAQANAAQAEMHAGHPERAIARLRPALTKSPDQVQLALNLFAAECQAGHVDDATLVASATALRGTRDPGSLLVHWFERAIGQSKNPPCPQLTLRTIATLVVAAQHNPHLMKNAGRRQDIYYLQGRLALAESNSNEAMADFNRALDQQVRVTAALQQAALLGSTGFPRHGLAHLDHYAAERDKEAKPRFGMPRIHAWILHRQHYWAKELTRLRATLQDDAQQQATTSG
jgi:tetratricopeptide (TPR) repeat protein